MKASVRALSFAPDIRRGSDTQRKASLAATELLTASADPTQIMHCLEPYEKGRFFSAAQIAAHTDLGVRKAKRVSEMLIRGQRLRHPGRVQVARPDPRQHSPTKVTNFGTPLTDSGDQYSFLCSHRIKWDNTNRCYVIGVFPSTSSKQRSSNQRL